MIYKLNSTENNINLEATSNWPISTKTSPWWIDSSVRLTNTSARSSYNDSLRIKVSTSAIHCSSPGTIYQDSDTSQGLICIGSGSIYSS